MKATVPIWLGTHPRWGRGWTWCLIFEYTLPIQVMSLTGYPPQMGKREDLVFNIGVHCTYMGDELDWVPAPDVEEGGHGV